jgi:hypothetical protein
MLNRLRSHLTYANVMVTILAFIVLGGGATALASYLVSSNGQVGPDTISGHHPPSGDHANIIAASINGQDIQTASIGTAKLNSNAQGARAYGLVNGTSVSRSKNITSVTNPNPGDFCIALGGFIAASTASAVVTPDFTNDSTNSGANSSQAFAEVPSSGSGCPAGNLEVLTGYRSVVTGGGGVTSVNNNFANEGFFIVVG